VNNNHAHLAGPDLGDGWLGANETPAFPWHRHAADSRHPHTSDEAVVSRACPFSPAGVGRARAFSRDGVRLLSCSRKMRRGGSRPTWRSCRSCCGRISARQAMPAAQKRPLDRRRPHAFSDDAWLIRPWSAEVQPNHYVVRHANRNGDPGGDEAVFNATPGSL
jgi:hypothetical protein